MNTVQLYPQYSKTLQPTEKNKHVSQITGSSYWFNS